MKHLLLLFIGISALTLSSCSVGAAEKIADEFHQKLDAGEKDYILDNLVDIENYQKEDWASFIDQVMNWGPQTNRKQNSGFSSKTNNGITMVKLGYTFNIPEYGLMHERLILTDRGEGYKITTALMNSDESVVEEGTAAF